MYSVNLIVETVNAGNPAVYTNMLCKHYFMNKTILIVDDSDFVIQMISFTLEQEGYTTLSGIDGKDALKHFDGKPIDLVITDLNMPNMDGLQLLSVLKAKTEWKKVPFVMITTEGSHNKVLEAVNLGAAGYVRKPFTAEQIMEKLVGLV